ncbi:MAG TPA: UMP kinase [bacterium]|nr:UMP kinase [bacterium]
MMNAELRQTPFHRILLKVSGESLGGGRNGIDSGTLKGMVEEIAEAARRGIQIAIVCGGGNIYRGIQADQTIDRTAADAMGMLATMINGIALREFFNAGGIPAEAMGAYPIEGILPAFSAQQARRFLDQGTVLILCGGTGLPYFSTDTAAAMRALQIQADVLIKATKVDGVYDRDPVTYSDATRFERLSYNQVLSMDLKVMDAASIALCRDNGLPVLVFNLTRPGNLEKLLSGEPVGTLITQKGDNHD